MSPETENEGSLDNKHILVSQSEPLRTDAPSSAEERKDLILYLRPSKISKLIKRQIDLGLNLTKFKKDFSFTRAFDKMACLGLGLTVFDLGSDGLLSYNFLRLCIQILKLLIF